MLLGKTETKKKSWMCSQCGMIEEMGRTWEVNSLKFPVGEKWSLSHVCRPKNYINMSLKEEHFCTYKGESFWTAVQCQIFSCAENVSKVLAGALENRAHFYAQSASPLGHSISTGCTGVVFGTWAISQETTTTFHGMEGTAVWRNVLAL